LEIPIPADWLYLALRLAFVGLLYLFIWQITRVLMRDLQRAARSGPARPRPAKIVLVVVDPADSDLAPGFSYRVGARTTIGRRPDCDVAIDEPSVSAVHAAIESRNLGWYLVDLDSTNGTFVNGSPVAGTAYIEADDIVQFGRIKLRVAT
jgi:hypothetical protein